MLYMGQTKERKNIYRDANISDFKTNRYTYVAWGRDIYRVRLIYIEESDNRIYLGQCPNKCIADFCCGDFTGLNFHYDKNGNIPSISIVDPESDILQPNYDDDDRWFAMD